ncbi:MAG TPA: hypothetical protein VHS53_16390 [Mucilaginibacter sp.]|jgi:hypothetical protein|nr:hypothetical protein [Mucilaginibacter sp.]
MSVLGKLVYKFYYAPKNKRAFIKKFGGRQNYSAMLAAEQEMKTYALNDLPINANFNRSGKFKINFLTGDKFIHQTLFCTHSFSRFLNKDETSDFSVSYYSDGTLSAELIALLKKRFPQIKIVGTVEIEKALAEHLPQSSFPYLNKNVRQFPLFKKLVYPNLNNDGLLTFFDSDMLFLNRPEAFLNWLNGAEANKEGAFCIQDVSRSYGYSDAEILRVWPEVIRHDINSGMYAIHSEHLDWPFIEDLARRFELNFGPHYYMEQLITAIILEKSKDLFVAPRSEYIVFPSFEQIQKQIGTLHHYVNESKEYYFKDSWRRQIT